MKGKIFLVLCTCLVITAGCAGNSSSSSATETSAPANAEQRPANQGAFSPEEQSKEQPANALPDMNPARQVGSTTDIPRPAVGIKVWAVDPANRQEAELLYSSPEPLLLEGVSPDGRYWLFEKVLGQVMGDPRGFSFLLDRRSGILTQGPQLNMHPAKVVWSGRGFWVNDLLHLGLDRQVEDYVDLGKAVGLGPGRRLLAASFTSDGRRVALVIDNERLNPAEARADLIWAEAGGKILARADHSIQPMAYFGKSGPFVELAVSPDGAWIALLSQSPGIALIGTNTLDPGKWLPVLRPFSPPVPLEKSEGGPPGGPHWAPDGRHLWVPMQSIVDPTGPNVVTIQQPSPAAIWKTDGTGLAVWAEPGKAMLRLVSLDGRSQDISVPESAWPIAFLPDGRLLVARTNVP